MDAIISDNGTWLVTHKENGEMDKVHALAYLKGWFWNTIDVYKYIINMDIKRYFLEEKGKFIEITKEEAILKYIEINEFTKQKNKAHIKTYKR